MLFDLHNKLGLARGISPVSVADNTAQVSQIIDMQGKKSLMWAIAAGSLADVDATFTVLVQHGDVANLSDAADVPDDMLNGTEALAGFTFAADDKVFKIGYRGDKRYVRLTLTPAANASAAVVCVIAVFEPLNTPAINPPA